MKNKLLTALLTSVSLMAGSVAVAQTATGHAPSTVAEAAAMPSPASMGDKASASMAATPSATAADVRMAPDALSATQSSRMEVERVGTTEPGQDEIASEGKRTAKKPVKKASTKKTVKKAKATKATKATKVTRVSKSAKVDAGVNGAAAAVQPGVPTNLAQ